MNGYQVQDAWMKHAARQRAGGLAVEEVARRARAVEKVRGLMPETTDSATGTVCGWAVMAVLNLWREHGEGNVRASQVKAERARLLKRLRTHGPNAPRQDRMEAAA